ncbi:hypothetical protein BDV59DRAFT_208814 [Aspergillus ambiguus]|uniref:uncharacterized protein n=1 Tax=Aspergillus ambiguus TaxID=176160 RepID=UPI003CCE0CEF
MAASLLRTSARTAFRASAPKAGVAGLTFARGKATLPDLAYDYGALEPSISGKIMELHHKNHHQTYVNSYNTAIEQLQEAQAKNDISAQIALKPLINFHGGGHINHTLFWENLAPKNAGGGEPPSGALAKAIDSSFGGLEQFQNQMNAALAGIQGSGWAWLVKDKQTGNIGIKTYARRGFRAFFANALRPKKSRQVLRKDFSASTPSLRSGLQSRDGFRYSDDVPPVPPMPDLTPLEKHRLKYRELNANKDTQLGENRDHTAMLHAIGVQELENPTEMYDEYDPRPPGEPLIEKLPPALWQLVAEFMTPGDRASLGYANKTLLARLGGPAVVWGELDLPENRDYKNDFLATQERYYPHHLHCYPCAIFHRRIQEGREKLQPADVVNPLFDCPNLRNIVLPPPRHRITHNRTIPYTFVNLVMRAHRFGPAYGIPADTLARRWRRDGWSHHTRYYIHNGHLLMRVVSSCFAEPGLPPSSQRLLLYGRDDYWPYFSACAHWRDGELMNVCKCALGHIPKPRATAGLQGVEHRAKDIYHGRIHNPNAITTLCGKCRPMRRCPECPSEYLVEIKLTEDRADPRSMRFRHAIVVTRWTDLGNGMGVSSRVSPEWAAITGTGDEPYDSFGMLGKRTISGTFESSITDDTLPGQRVISMNPKGKKEGEEGTGWY